MDEQQKRGLPEILQEIKENPAPAPTKEQALKLRTALVARTKQRVYEATARQTRLLQRAEKTYSRRLTAALR